MKLALGNLLLMAFVINHSLTIPTAMAASSPCDYKCAIRCSKASVQDRCLKYCGICCKECNNCVPSGTYGNKQECPCYRDKKSSKGKPKCP